MRAHGVSKSLTHSVAQRAAGTVHLLRGDWAKARSMFEREIAVLRSGNIVNLLPHAVASCAWALAQLHEASEALNRLREGGQLVESFGLVAHRSWVYHALGRA